MKKYVHTVHYYETDKMAITHHSNYIRWMEEARVDFLEQLGWGFDKLEGAGIGSPVLSVTCDYKHSTKFADRVEISVSVLEFTGVRLTIGYEMYSVAGDLCCTATSSHCFLNSQGRPVRLQKEFPEFYAALMEHLVPKAE